MPVAAEIRIGLHIGKRVVHPAHVPLVVEPQPAEICGFGDHRERRAFFRDHQRPRIQPENRFVEFFEKRDGFEIIIPPVHVGRPFARLFIVIEIDHGGDGVHAQSVDMELFKPEHRVGNEKTLHFVPAPVENARTPAFHLHFIFALVFVTGRTVEFEKPVFVFRKMRRHPVEDYADAVIMESVHQPHKSVRRAETRRNAEISRYLIPPATVERVFRNGHEFHVGIPHLFDVRHELCRKFIVSIVTAVGFFLPAAEMYFVNIYGRGINRIAPFRFAVRAVLPLVSPEIVDLGSGARRRFAVERVGIGLVHPSLFRFNGIFIGIVSFQPRDKGFVNALCADALHRVAFGIPAVEIAHDGNGFRTRRPRSEKHALFALAFAEMRAQIVIGFVIRALMKQRVRNLPQLFISRGKRY